MCMSGKCIREDNWDVENIDWLTRKERTVSCHGLCLIIIFYIIVQQVLDRRSDQCSERERLGNNIHNTSKYRPF